MELKADIYIPAGAKPGQRFPCVVLISGGGLEPDWRKAGVYQSYGRLLAASGFVAVTFNKRYARSFESLASGEADTIDLVSFVRENNAAYFLHPDRIAVWAFSAGGPMLTPFMRARPSYVRAMLAFYAVLDTPNRPEMTDEDRKQWEKYSARANIPFPGRGCCLPPILVARAGLDSLALNEGIDNFLREGKKEENYAQVELLEHSDGRHAFDILDDNQRTREILRSALAFLQKNLAPQR